ncbi:MAG: GNAT family N-acetyltransferase [bacterium]|nr:GNAT family N-acetyltransferase [bacterium]
MDASTDGPGPPVGERVDPPPAARSPDGRPLVGEAASVVRLEAAHDGELWASLGDGAAQEALWTYMAYGPFDGRAAFGEWVASCVPSDDPLFHAIVPSATGQAAGMAALMHPIPEHGVIELGHIWFSPQLRRTRAATESLYLLMRHAFEDLGNRRLEWKCDALNAPSRRAAERLGFRFEGVFRQHLVIKGRNRDTAWYALLDREWPAVRAEIENWLADSNFDSTGAQKTQLEARMAR